MNDEFLYRLRVSPPASFTSRLKLRLDALAWSQARRRTYRRLYMVAGLFMAGTALALVAPSVRNYTMELFGIEVRQDDVTAVAEPQASRGPAGGRVVSPFTGRGRSRDETRNAPDAMAGGASGEQLVSLDPFSGTKSGNVPADVSTSEAPAAPTEEIAGGVVRAPAIITLDGSATVQPLTKALVERFQRSTRSAVRFGTDHFEAGPAFAKLCRREVDLVHSVRPIDKPERATCTSFGTEYLELPVAYEVLTVVVSPHNQWMTALSREDLRKIDRSGARNAIDPAWPARRLSLYGLGRQAVPDMYSPDAMSFGWSRGAGITAVSLQALVSRVYADVYAIAYLPYVDFEANAGKLKSVPIVNSQGVAVAASDSSIDDATYELSRPIFLYVNANSADRPEVDEFLEFYLQQGTGAIREAKFTPLAPLASRKALQNFRNRKIGTVFADQPVRVPVDQILSREAKRYAL